MDGNAKKPTVCRYFAASGDCYYGDECQYIHQTIGDRPPIRAMTTGSETHTLSQLPAESKLSTYLSSLYNHNNHDLTPQISALSLETANSRRKIVGTAPVSSAGVSVLSGSSVGNGITSNTPLAQSTNQLTTQVPLPPPSYFISEEIKLDLLRKQNVLLAPAAQDITPDLPDHVDNFHELVPLESPCSTLSSTFGLVTSVYRATNMKTGEVVCLRRIHSFQPNTTNTKGLIVIIDNWKKLIHSNIVQLKQVLTTKAFRDNSLIFVYDYFPAAQTLMNQCFGNSVSGSGSTSVNGLSTTARPYSQQQNQRPKLLPESIIWTFIIQLSSALRTIHANNLACRSFDPTKIIITNGFSTEGLTTTQQHPRLRLSSVAVVDVVAHETFLQDLQRCNHKILITHYQQEDLLAFGKLCLALACNSLSAVKRENWHQSLDLISRHYSGDLRSLIVYLLSVKSSTVSPKNINDIMPMIGARFYAQLDLAYQRYDILESEVAKELENGRLFRALCKLGTINERPEFRMDPQWSETGDRYLLKLFRDYLFHQVNEDGHPWLDVGHIVSTLNKLDVGSPEKICLVSRDDQNILIVSFAELKKCFEAAFNELLL
ncbi:PAB-dependent poly(A)-specific ribonuclease subunit 3-like protein [Dinothrombium tinctorium]|uniref:PAN2-PAN3 deadenylation complex subunit PAN3 n=1 Tax=Dinothrombium tinctorium TaxID=1965070 RepID=A0A3S3QM01_9ACAR|nr:PAB-dependent poly(A)-specific ribonuclease subunit 3-like protein [Dinothrombium tinctorium]